MLNISQIWFAIPEILALKKWEGGATQKSVASENSGLCQIWSIIYFPLKQGNLKKCTLTILFRFADY